MYRVAWKSLVTGISGAGECFAVDFAQLERFVNEANRTYPEVFHWIEACVS